MNIGIVGAGISGLHLALRLQQSGVDTTLYSTKSADEQRAGRPVNFVARWGRTRERERGLGVAHWNYPDWGIDTLRMTISGEHPLKYQADLLEQANGVDFRLYLPQLMDDYEARGGTVVIGPAEIEDIHRRSAAHDLIVVASGSKSVNELFPRDPSRSAYTGPQRLLSAGLFTGIANESTPGVEYQIVPGSGEVFRYPFHSLAGRVSVLGFEIIPDGAFEHLAHLRHTDDLPAYHHAVLAALAIHVPGVRERINEREFGLARPIDAIQGSVTPVVRHGWSALAEGKYAIAVGDAWVVNDPLTGQGANLGSYNAFQLADAILAGPPFDEHFCRTTEAAMWSHALAVTEWTSMFLQPPPPHLIDLHVASAMDERVAHAFLNHFNDPPAMWDTIATPEQAASFLARVKGGELAQAS